MQRSRNRSRTASEEPTSGTPNQGRLTVKSRRRAEHWGHPARSPASWAIVFIVAAMTRPV